MENKHVLTKANQLAIICILLKDYKDNKLENIQKLYAACDITNEKLKEQYHKHFYPLTSFPEHLFSDMIYLIADSVSKSEELTDYFRQLYDTRFRDTADLAQKVAALYKKANHEKANLLARQSFNSEDIDLFFFLFLCLNTTDLRETYGTKGSYLCNIIGLLRYSDDPIPQFILHGNVKSPCRVDQDYIFLDNSGKESPVFQSQQFTRFVKQNRQEIADQAKVVDEKDLDAYFKKWAGTLLSEIVFDKLEEPAYAGLMTAVSFETGSDKYAWKDLCTKLLWDCKNCKIDVDSIIDVNSIIEDYCKTLVKIAYCKMDDPKTTFTRMYLSKRCPKPHPASALTIICFLIIIRILKRAISILTEKYYENFSWDDKLKQAQIKELRNIINSKDKIIEEKDNGMRVLGDKVRKLEEKSPSAGHRYKNTENNIPLLQENRHLQKQVQSLESKIKELKEKLKDEQEYIQLIETCQDPDKDPDENTSIENPASWDFSSSGSRFLFVGRTDAIGGTLRKYFPDSVYLNDKGNINISNIKVDAVVYLIPYMKHEMWNRVNAAANLQDVPRIFCNRPSANSILQSIADNMVKNNVEKVS